MARAYFTQFDDLLPRKMGHHKTSVGGDHYRSEWELPVTVVKAIKGGYEHVRLGTITITQFPNYEEGVMEIYMGIEMPEDEEAGS